MIAKSFLCLSLFLLPCTAAIAQNDNDDQSRKLIVHGYLTQAYARSEDHQVLGIPTDGTTDYRTAALQFRYSLTSKDNFVVQFSHERFGKSPFRNIKADVELDWAFYERKFSDTTSLKIGKVQIPLGIYNEVRDVGTILPFYRPAFNFYGEGAFTSETVDGFVASHSFTSSSDWSLDGDVYYGGWDLIEIEPTADTPVKGRVENTLGTQLWLNTPVPGLRVGFGANRFLVAGELLALGGEATVKTWHISGVADWDRFQIRSEFEKVHFPPGNYKAFYLQLGAMVIDKVQMNFQADFSHLNFAAPQGPVFDDSFDRDYAVGINYLFRSNLVAKLETHWADGYRVDEPINLFFVPSVKSRYTILSLSVSF